MSEAMGAFICGVTFGVVFAVVARFVWSELKREYEERVEKRAQFLARTKFAEFAGINK
jgi:hypothetical protein